MVPFCRRVEEAQAACIAAMARNGLERGDERARGLRHVRDPQQRHPDRRLRRAVRRLLDRLQRPDPADAGRRSGFRDRRLRFRRARSRACSRCCAWPSPAPSATAAMSASAARRRRTIRRSPRFLAGLGINSISVNAAQRAAHDDGRARGGADTGGAASARCDLGGDALGQGLRRTRHEYSQSRC